MEKLTEIVVTSNGHRMVAFKGDFITRRIKKSGLYEKPSLVFIKKFLASKSDIVVADIGANIGNHCLDFATYASRVYAFEPIDITFELLKENLVNNGFDNVTAVNQALSNVNEEAEIYLVKANMGASSLENRDESSEKRVVTKIIGDEFFESSNIERLDFIKIDVEGHEAHAIQGLEKTIAKFKPSIMMEWIDEEGINKFNSSGLMEQLLINYKVYVLGSSRDEEYWKNKVLGRLRRKLAKIFLPNKAVLYDFDSSKQYRNILLIPLTAAGSESDSRQAIG